MASTIKVDKLFSESPSGATENILLNDDGTTNLKGNTTVTGTCTATTFSGSGASLTNVPDSALSAVTASKLTGALPAISGASLTGITSSDTLNNRNILINGAMRIRQRDDVANAGNEYGGPDRWFFWKNDGAFSIAQVDQVPDGQGFKNSYHIDCTSVSGTAGANYVGILQKLEGKDVIRLKYGSSNAESLTLSFWIRSTKTGTYIATLENKDQTKHISKSYTVSASNTWEKKTITFPGDTASGAQFDNDTGESLKLILWVFAGSSYTSGTLATSWASVVDANSAVGQVNAGDNTSNDIYFTGVQLEPGTTATEFEHRLYGEELARCQRYYEVLCDGVTQGLATCTCWGTSETYSPIVYQVEKRTTPSFEVSATDDFGIMSNTAFNTATAIGQTDTNVRGTRLYLGVSSAPFVNGHSGWIKTTSDCKFAANSEL